MLLDTSGLLCYHHRREPLHEEAVRRVRSAPAALTHGYVLAELVPLAACRGVPRGPILELLADLEANPWVEVVFVDRGLHASARELVRRRPDKAWSLCDAVSFLLMSERGLREALTTDHHFEQAGFTRLLRP